MAGSEVKGTAKVNVNGQEAGIQLKKLEQKAIELRKAIVKVNKAEILDRKKLKNLRGELTLVNKETKQVKRSMNDYNVVLKNLSKSSINDLRTAYLQLNREVNSSVRGTQEYINKKKKLAQLKGVWDREKKSVRELSNEIGKAGAKSQSFGMKASNAFNQFAGAVMAVTAIITGLIMAFRKIGDVINTFEKSFTNVLTLLSDADVEKYGTLLEEGSIDIIKRYGFAIEDTNKALFDTISAGVDAADAINVVDEASILAVGGVTNLSTATDGLTTVMNAWKLEASEASKVSAAFFSAQKAGKTTVAELAANIGKVAPLASNLGVSYQEVLSTLAELTKNGISTAESTTMLKAAFASLQKPSAAAAKVLKKYGVPVGSAEIKAKGLTYTLGKLNEMIEQNPDAVSKAIPSVEGLTAVISLSGKGLEDYQEILKNVNEDYGENSSLTKAFAKQQETAAQAIARAKGSLIALTLSLREQLSPVIKAVMSQVSEFSNLTLKFSANAKGVLTFVTDMIKQSGSLTDVVKDTVKEFYGFLKVIFNLLSTFDIFKGKVSAADVIIKILSTTLKLVFAPIRAVIWGLTKFNEVILYVITHSRVIQGVIKGVGEVFEWLTDIFADGTVAGEFFGKTVDVIKAHFEGLLKIAKKVFDFMLRLDDLSEDVNTSQNSFLDAYLLRFALMRQAAEKAYKIAKKRADEAAAEEEKQKIIRIKAAEEEYKKRKKANQDLQDLILLMNVELIEDEKKKAQEELVIWYEKEQAKINISVASANIRNEAALTLHALFNKKSLDLDQKYHDKQLANLEQINQFIVSTNQALEVDREAMMQAEIERIEQKFDKQIQLAEEEAAKNHALSAQFAQKAIEIEQLKQDTIIEYRLQKELEFAEKLRSIKEEYGLVTDEEYYQLEVDKLDNFYEQELISTEDYERAKKVIEDRYKEARIQTYRDEMKEKLKYANESLQFQNMIVSAHSGFIQAQKDADLQAAGDNEEKKKEIMKRYADKEFAIKTAQIVANTAVAIMQAYAQLGPVAGTIAAVFLAATGIVQVNTANNERKRIKGLAEGGSTIVERSQDGKLFNAEHTQSRGLISKPSVLVSEEGPEYVVPNSGLQNPTLSGILSQIEASRQRGDLKTFDFRRAIAATGFAEGGATSNVQKQTSSSKTDELLMILIARIEQQSSIINNQQTLLKAYVSYDDIEESLNVMNDIKEKTFIE